MSNSTVGLVENIRNISVGAVGSTKPVEVTIGVVKSIEPLKVKLSGGFVVSEAVLVLNRNVTDHEIEIQSVDGGGVQVIKIKNGLKVGEKVSITRLQGGKKYLIQDRVGM